MHASIDHLLNVRDGQPVAADMAEHIERCPTCSRELQRLSAARQQLQALPQLEPPPGSWERIRQGIAPDAAVRPKRVALLATAAAALATLAVIASVALRDSGAPAVAEMPTVPQPQTIHTPHVAELVAQSQELEQLLQTLPERPQIERVSTAATIDTIEQRIQWLDFQLSYAPEDALSEEQARRLWSERVELMDSLVKVRYAEAGRLSF